MRSLQWYKRGAAYSATKLYNSIIKDFKIHIIELKKTFIVT